MKKAEKFFYIVMLYFLILACIFSIWHIAMPLLGIDEFMPHGMCFFWAPWMIRGLVLANGTIAFSYFLIPVLLAISIRRRPDIAFNWLLWGFALFILFCGTTHIFKIYTIWIPAYRISLLMDVLTALTSLTVALAFAIIFPRYTRLPSVRNLTKAVGILKEELQRREIEDEQRAEEINFALTQLKTLARILPD